MDRNLLQQAVSSSYPALADNDLVPAFGCFYFKDGNLCAYNNTIGISTPLPDFEIEDGGVEGELLSQWLKSTTGGEVKAQIVDGDVKLSCGRSRLTLRHRERKEFKFKKPKTKKLESLVLDNDQRAAFKRAVAQTAISIGVDPSKPTRLGLMLVLGKDSITMYATDNFTAARSVFAVQVPKAMQGRALSIPPHAVKALDKMPQDIYAQVYLEEDWALFKSPSGVELFSRAVAQSDASMYEELFGAIGWDDKKLWLEMGEEFAPAIQRAGFLSSEDVFTKAKLTKTAVTLETRGKGSNMHDKVQCKGKGGEGEALVNPKAVDRCLPYTTHLHFADGLGICFKADNYAHIVCAVMEE